jgi:hypothetical protein
MIRLDEVKDLVEINDLINGIGKLFRSAREEMRLGLHALCRNIKDTVPGYKMPPRGHYTFPDEVVWSIRDLLEREWHCTEFLVPLSDGAQAPLTTQIEALIAAEKQSPARRQGLRFSAVHTLPELRACIGNHTDLLYRSVLVPPENVRINAYDFSVLYRFWQQIWFQHGISGITVAFMLWRAYFEKIISKHQSTQAEHFQKAPIVTDWPELQQVLDLFCDTTGRERMQNRLLLTGTLCYRPDLAEGTVEHSVQTMVTDHLQPSLWAALRTFGPASLREKIDASRVSAAPPQGILESELLALILLFGNLDWHQIEQVLRTGSDNESRKIVSTTLGSSLALRRMAKDEPSLRKALTRAQNEGLIPDNLNTTIIPYIHPDPIINQVGIKARALSQ